MKLSTIIRIIRRTYFDSDVRRSYWATAQFFNEVRVLFHPANKAFRQEAILNQTRFVFDSVAPITGAIKERAQAGVGWILRAQAANKDGGVALGYFPSHSDGSAWRPSYPETTGYIITTLLAFAKTFGDTAVAAAAIRMAEWEMAIQMASGAVQGGPVCAPERQTAAAFNTGMVLDGWCSAYSHSRDPRLLSAARRAANFLVNDLDDKGFFKTNGAYVSAGEVKTYTCLCAWAIYRFGELAEDDSYKQAAVLVIEAALSQQQPNGWFAHNCLTQSDSPLTHTIGYTLQGVLEVGILAKRPDFLDAVRRTADAVLPRISSNGYLPGRFFADWEPASFSSCLTGSAQIAIVCYRLFEQTGDVKYREQADKLLNYLKSLQLLQSEDLSAVGAIAGSFPLFGGYMRAGYPNWATKYFLDALMLQNQFCR